MNFRFKMNLRRAREGPSGLVALQEVVRILGEGPFQRVRRTTVEEVDRAQPAVLTNCNVNVRGQSADVLFNARNIHEFSEELFDKSKSEIKNSTPDLPVEILERFYIKEGQESVECEWPLEILSNNRG